MTGGGNYELQIDWKSRQTRTPDSLRSGVARFRHSEHRRKA